MNKRIISCVVFCVVAGGAEAQPSADFHLTARPWEASGVERGDYIEALEGLCQFAVRHVNDDGAFIDPFLGREHQYATPYFAYAVGALLAEGRGEPFKDAGIRAVDHSTEAVAGGHDAIPDGHGEFFLASLADALELYAGHVDEQTMAMWRERMSVPITRVIKSLDERTNNWRTYGMKGEWARVNAGLVARDDAIAFIEDAWLRRTQRERIVLDALNLYQDWNGHPQSHAVEAVGRGNLAALIHSGYDGPSADSIRHAVGAGTEVSLLLQDPTGQCPPNGRTDDHVFNDVLYGLIFEAAAEDQWAAGEEAAAGRYRRASSLAFESIQRWLRDDGDWAGSFYITKNHFDPADRVGYQPASQYGNYTGAVMYHLAETLRIRRNDIPEQAAPSEIGGYAFATDARFGSAVLNAGGMQVFLNMLGDSVAKYDKYWTPLGVVRFSRAGWDSRLGPSDGARDFDSKDAVTFAPTWKLGPTWVRLADMAEHYRGTLRVDFVHPLLVRASVLYAPVTGVGGPSFFLDLTVTPDGVLASLHSPNDAEFGLTIPLLENDGRDLDVLIGERKVGTRYPDTIGNGDEQWFIGVDGTRFSEAGESVRSTYGWLKPMRATSDGERVEVFIYPRSQEDPTAESVLQTFVRSEDGFGSVLGRASSRHYAGRWAAGGYGNRIDLDADWRDDVTFNEACYFVLKSPSDGALQIETDRSVDVSVAGLTQTLAAHTPENLKLPAGNER